MYRGPSTDKLIRKVDFEDRTFDSRSPRHCRVADFEQLIGSGQLVTEVFLPLTVLIEKTNRRGGGLQIIQPTAHVMI